MPETAVSTVHILLLDDHTLFRESYSKVLRTRKLRIEWESPKARSKPRFSSSSRRLEYGRAVNWFALS